LFCSRQSVVAAEHLTVSPRGSELPRMRHSEVTTVVTQEFGQPLLQETDGLQATYGLQNLESIVVGEAVKVKLPTI